MAKVPSSEQPAFRCGECGATSGKWMGRCGQCQSWGTVEPARGRRRPGATGITPSAPARPIADIDALGARASPTGFDELDRVLGGGLVPGAVVLLAGEPGVGKSTLLLEVAARFAQPGRSTLYVTGEESAAQVRLRAGRIGALHPQLYLAAETDLGAVLAHVDEVEPALLVVDSVQTICSASADGAAGGVTQVRAVAAELIALAKERAIVVVLVGHVTKDGSVAGPRMLEHQVDVVVQFEGERHSRLRVLRAWKNRYGSADEIGCFDLTDDGIWCVPDPSGLFLSRHAEPVAGTCVTVSVEGKRALPVEVQALLVPSPAGARRTTNGLDSARVAMILAVLHRRAGLVVSSYDVYAATVGGVRVSEPAADLAVAMAAASSMTDVALPPDLVAIGEVGLAGEVRRVTGVQRRLAEAARLGFRRALVPPESGPVPPQLHVVEVPDVCAARAAVERVS